MAQMQNHKEEVSGIYEHILCEIINSFTVDTFIFQESSECGLFCSVIGQDQISEHYDKIKVIPLSK